jgi:hypothetical protein
MPTVLFVTCQIAMLPAIRQGYIESPELCSRLLPKRAIEITQTDLAEFCAAPAEAQVF